MARFGKLNFAQKTCVAKTGLLMQKTEMVWPGARIGMAVSGGVDSLVLAQVMLIRQAIIPFDVELFALHVNPGFDDTAHQALTKWCISKGLGIHVELSDIGPRAFGPENRKRSPCFLCSMRRRTMLFELCERYKLTHLALGHMAEDLASTFMLNLIRGGRVDGLSHKEGFFGGQLTVIRPMLLLDKDVIQRAARAWKLPVTANPCPAVGVSGRDEAMEWLKELWAKTPKAKTNMLAGLARWQLDGTGCRP